MRAEGKKGVEERLNKVKVMTHIMEKDKKKHVDIMAQEIGKPMKEASLEVDKCISHCNYYIENTMKFIEDEEIK